MIFFLILLIYPSVLAESNSYNWVREDSDYCSEGICIGSLNVLGNLTVRGEYVNVTVTNFNVTNNIDVFGNITADYFFGDGSFLTYGHELELAWFKWDSDGDFTGNTSLKNYTENGLQRNISRSTYKAGNGSVEGTTTNYQYDLLSTVDEVYNETTVAAWFKPHEAISGATVIWESIDMELFCLNDTDIRLTRSEESGGWIDIYANVPEGLGGRWTHVVAQENANGTMRLYVNGKLKNKTALSHTNLNRWQNFAIGHRGADYKLSGFVDDLRIYGDVSLSYYEILALYNEGLGTGQSLMELRNDVMRDTTTDNHDQYLNTTSDVYFNTLNASRLETDKLCINSANCPYDLTVGGSGYFGGNVLLGNNYGFNWGDSSVKVVGQAASEHMTLYAGNNPTVNVTANGVDIDGHLTATTIDLGNPDEEYIAIWNEELMLTHDTFYISGGEIIRDTGDEDVPFNNNPGINYLPKWVAGNDLELSGISEDTLGTVNFTSAGGEVNIHFTPGDKFRFLETSHGYVQMFPGQGDGWHFYRESDGSYVLFEGDEALASSYDDSYSIFSASGSAARFEGNTYLGDSSSYFTTSGNLLCTSTCTSDINWYDGYAAVCDGGCSVAGLSDGEIFADYRLKAGDATASGSVQDSNSKFWADLNPDVDTTMEFVGDGRDTNGSICLMTSWYQDKFTMDEQVNKVCIRSSQNSTPYTEVFSVELNRSRQFYIDSTNMTTVYQDLNLRQDFIHNEHFAQGFYHSYDTPAEVYIDNEDVYYNFTNLTIDFYNGFNPVGIGVNTTKAGYYKIDGGLSFSGGNSGVYEFEVFNNEQGLEQCVFFRSTSTTAIGHAGMSCIVNLTVGDHLTLRIKDITAPAQDVNVYQANMNIIEI